MLTADLDCSASAGTAVTLERFGRLDLAGFTLTGAAAGGVGCFADCTIEGGGGTIADSGGNGVIAQKGRIMISDVLITGNAGKYAIGSDSAKNTRVTFTDVDVIDNANFGVFGRRVEVRGGVSGNWGVCALD